MGIMNRWTPNDQDKSQFGGHGMQHSDILNPNSEAITPASGVDWSVAVPTVIKNPQTSSLQQADASEREAGLYKLAVDNGLRRFKAEAKKQEDNARLVRGHRQYLAKTAQAHMEIAAANRGLAGKLHGLREQYAQMGHSLDRKEQETQQKIDLITAKYRGLN